MSDAPDSAPAPEILARVAIKPRWGDMDSFGHVNNVKFASYLEEARCRWLIGVPGMEMRGPVLPVLVNANINYRRPIVWPNDIVVELFIERAGKSSLTIGHRIIDSQDAGILYSDGNVTLVWMDTGSGTSVPLPDAIRGLG